MSKFHSLKVTDVQNTIRDAVVVTLQPEKADLQDFDFIPGQYLTFRKELDGEELRRSYSICSGKDDGVLRVGIKRVEGGRFSNWANDNLKPGDMIEVMPPTGGFHAPLQADARRHYLGFAGGSGITPVLSIIKTTLSREPESRFTLLYANRSVSTIMFREELEDLKNSYMGRFNILHILEDDAQEIDLFTGRIDAGKCEALFAGWVDIEDIDLVYICGPEPMMLGIVDSLKRHGIDEGRIKYELFATSAQGAPRARAKSGTRSENDEIVEASVTLDGTTRIFRMPKAGQSLLEAALENHIDAPYSCKAGICSTCKAKVLEGEVEMVANHALEDYEVEQGYVLTCQCHPVSSRVVVDYDR